MSFDELLKAAKDRLNSPVSGTFCLIWIVVNWRIPLYLTFGYQKMERIDLLTNYLNTTDIWTLLLYPMLLTAGYIPGILLLRLINAYVTSKYNYLIGIIDEQTNKNLQENRDYGSTLFHVNRDLYWVTEECEEFLNSICRLISKQSSANRSPQQTILEVDELCKKQKEYIKSKLALFKAFASHNKMWPPEWANSKIKMLFGLIFLNKKQINQ